MNSRPTKNGTAGFDASGPKGRRPAHTYLLGFDAACIALCRACFDQLAKAVLLKGRIFREAELRKGHLTSLGLADHLRRHKLIGDAYDGLGEACHQGRAREIATSRMIRGLTPRGNRRIMYNGDRLNLTPVLRP